MNTQTNLIQKDEAIKGLLSGIELATDAIRPGYGSNGTNVIIEHELYPYHMIVNDCDTIVQAIQSKDPAQKLGLDMFKELSAKANKDSADGRKTTLLIAYELIKRGLESKMPRVQLKRVLDAFIPIIEAKINEQKKPISENEIAAVAEIAGESKEMAEVLQEIYQHIGRDGIIIPEPSGTYQTSYSLIHGVRFIDTGYLSPYMVHDEEAVKDGRKETKAIYENPLILITKRKIEKDSDIAPILDYIIKNNKPLVIFTDDMDSGVAMRMVATHRAKVAKILIVKAPTLWKQYVYEDFSKITGATIVEDSSGINFKTLKLEHLGTCAKLSVSEEEMIVLGGKDITDHIKELRAKDDNDSKLRVSWLSTKTAILKIGANNESEMSYKRLKCYDAINSSRLALKDGVVQGGGLCLFRVSNELIDALGGDIVSNALRAPINQICENEGCTIDEFCAKIDSNVLDAAAVVKNAVRNAISLASTVLTSSTLIYLFPKPKETLTDRRINF